MLRLALLGVGAIARYYRAAVAVAPGAELIAACDLDEHKLQRYRAEGLMTSTDYRELLAEPAIEGVLVSAPNDVHARMCQAALEAGKHVCCEKPLVLDGREARRLARIAQQRQRVLFTAFHRRYNRNMRSLLQTLAAHRARGVHAASCRVRYFERIEEHCQGERWYLDPLRSGGGVLADNGPNAIDVAEMLLGPASVDCAHIERNRMGVDYRAAVRLRARSGAHVVCELDWAYAHGELKDVTLELSTGERIHADMLAGFPAFKSSLVHEYRRILADFARAINGESHEGGHGEHVVATVSDAYRVARDVSPLVFHAL